MQTTLQNYIAPSVPAPSVPRTAPPESPAQSRPSFNKDVPANDRLDVLLAVNDTLQAKMGAKIEEVMHELEADSPPRSKRAKPEAADGPPTPLEKGDAEDPVVLSPPGKTQRLLDAAKE